MTRKPGPNSKISIDGARQALKRLRASSSSTKTRVESKKVEFGRLHQIAALRTEFLPENLLPSQAAPDSREVSALLQNSRAIERRRQKGARWSLNPDVRRQVLDQMLPQERQRLATAEFARLSERDGTSADELTQRMLLLYVLGKGPDLGKQSREELAVTAKIVEWLEGLPGLTLPTQREVQQYRYRQELLAPFRSLTKNFQGRQKELDRLSNYVDWLPSTSVGAKIEGAIRGVLNLYEKPPLMIYGVGGSGKTTLIAEFVRRHFDQEADRIAFLYFDFDTPAVSIREPLTLIVEGLRQLALQFPRHGEKIEAAAAEIADQLADSSRRVAENIQASSPLLEASVAEQGQAVMRFGQIWNEMGRSEEPLLLVLDSFEEMQARQASFLPELFSFLQVWVDRVPRLRVVIAGRSEIQREAFPTDKMKLGDFDERAAIGFLKSRHVENERLARRIYQTYGANPLVLHLAAEFVRKQANPDELLGDESMWSVFRYRLDSRHAQRVLFQRNLSHIDDPECAKLAFPGLAVRRLSATVIENVLSKPCRVDLGADPADRAGELLRRLRRQAFLVETDDEGELCYRHDLRQMMLPLVEKEEPRRTRQIHDLAIEHYTGAETARDRAEEIYHRLMRHDDPLSVQVLLTPDVTPYLEHSLEELPPRGQLVVGSVLGLTVAPEVIDGAKLQDWELRVATEVGSLLESGHESAVQRAETKLRSRRERSPMSPLFRCEANVCNRLGKPEKARRAAEAALEIARQSLNTREQLEMLFLLARVQDELGAQAAARRHLRSAHRLASSEKRFLEATRAKLDELNLLLRNPTIKKGKVDSISERISRLIGKLDADELKQITAYAPFVLSRNTRIAAAVHERTQEVGEAGAERENELRVHGDPDSPLALQEAVASAEQLAQYTSDVQKALGSNRRLEGFLNEQFGVRLREFTSPGSIDYNVFETLRFAERHGWLTQLLSSLDIDSA